MYRKIIINRLIKLLVTENIVYSYINYKLIELKLYISIKVIELVIIC